MPKGPSLRTERLLLRRWRGSDLDAFAAINADPEVMEHMPATLTRASSAALIERFERFFEDHGYGLWALEIPGEASLAGYVGIDPVEIDVPFAPAVELSWRLGRPFWGRGIASEAAGAAMAFAFERLALAELVAYTTVANGRSRRLMERLRMVRDPAEDFLHPGLPPDSQLAPHVLYRIDAERWHAGAYPRGACVAATPTRPASKN
jgi:RimJ/RimL family protein N-acetyltransferase